ncbi:MAG: family hydrolase [Rhodospirillales bacterium]|nr:family hydrolase [Rhodospirillales bacterium]
MTNQQPPRGIIFDVDGTLVDSVDLHAKAWQEAFAHFGHEIAFAHIRSQIGKGGDQLMPVFLDKAELKRIGEALEKFRGKHFKQHYLPLVRAFPDVAALFRCIRDAGQRIALASSAKDDELAVYKEIAGITDLVDAETSSDDAEKSKPYPDILVAALEKLKLPPAEAIVVGDSPYDAEAAAEAGLATVGLLCGGFPRPDLEGARCVALYADPSNLLRNYAISPLAASAPGTASSEESLSRG